MNAEDEINVNECSNAEDQEMLEKLGELLEGVIPQELLSMIKSIKPVKYAVALLLGYGGRIRLRNPEIALKKPYEYPDALNVLNDNIGSFSFELAPIPFVALARAVSGDINADEEIIMSCDLKGFVPLVIKKDDKVTRIGLVNYENRKLELTLEIGLQLDIDMTGDAAEQEKAMKDGLETLDDYLGNQLKQLLTDPPELFASPQEEKAVTAWCEKHSYTLSPIIRSSIDRYF